MEEAKKAEGLGRVHGTKDVRMKTRGGGREQQILKKEERGQTVNMNQRKTRLKRK